MKTHVRSYINLITYLLQYTLRLHYNAVVGVHGKKTHNNGPCYIHATVKIFNTAFFTGFPIRKQMPHPPSFGMGHQSVYLVFTLHIAI